MERSDQPISPSLRNPQGGARRAEGCRPPALTPSAALHGRFSPLPNRKPSHRSHCEGATKRPWQSLQWRLANRYALGALLHGSCKPNRRFGQLLKGSLKRIKPKILRPADARSERRRLKLVCSMKKEPGFPVLFVVTALVSVYNK